MQKDSKKKESKPNVNKTFQHIKRPSKDQNTI